MLSRRRHSTSTSNNYVKSKCQNEQSKQKTFNFKPKYNLVHSKSDSFFQQEPIFANDDLPCMFSKTFKFTSNEKNKYPFFEITSEEQTFIKKSQSFDSIRNLRISKYLLDGKNFPRKNHFMYNSLSCSNFNDFARNQHSIYLIKGRIPCYSKILKKIDYSQYFIRSNPSDSLILNLTEFFDRDDRVNEREVNYLKSKKVRYFFRGKNNQKNKKNRKKDLNTNESPQKERPRFKLYGLTNTPSPTKKSSSINLPPRFSPAFILNERYNIRSRVFKENNIRNFMKELAIAEDEDRRFVLDTESDEESLKRKRSRSVESNSPYRTFPIKKVRRSKSAQTTFNYKQFFNSPSSSPKKLQNRPRFRLFSPQHPSPQFSKKIVKPAQPPKPSPASVLNEKYNIRSRLFKEMHIHEFYKDLAVAEKEEKVKKSMEQVQMSPNSKKIVENYIQRIIQSDSTNNTDNQSVKSQNETDNQSTKSNTSQRSNKSQGNNKNSRSQSDNQSTKSNSSNKSNRSQSNIKNSQSQSDNRSTKSNTSQKSNRSQSINKSIKSNQSQNDNQSIKSNTSNKSNRSQNNIKNSQSQSDNRSTKSNTSNKSQNDNKTIESLNDQKENDNQCVKNNQSESEINKNNRTMKSQDEINELIESHRERKVKRRIEGIEKDKKEKEEEEMSPPKVKKFAHKVPGFISNVSNFLKEYDICIKYDDREMIPNQKKKKQ